MNCPRCNHDLSVNAPKRGEVWLRADTRKLYVITQEWYDGYPGSQYATGERLHPRGMQGCDPEYKCALWRDAVMRGDWIKVEGMSAE